MHRHQFRGRQPCRRIAVIFFHLIGRAEFFQQPQNPLRARVIEMMEREHGISSRAFLNAWSPTRLSLRAKRSNPSSGIESMDYFVALLPCVNASRLSQAPRHKEPSYPAQAGDLEPVLN